MRSTTLERKVEKRVHVQGPMMILGGLKFPIRNKGLGGDLLGLFIARRAYGALHALDHAREQRRKARSCLGPYGNPRGVEGS